MNILRADKTFNISVKKTRQHNGLIINDENGCINVYLIFGLVLSIQTKRILKKTLTTVQYALNEHLQGNDPNIDIACEFENSFQ